MGHTCWPTAVFATHKANWMWLTYIPTCWSFLLTSNVAKMTWNNQIWNNAKDFFVLGRIAIQNSFQVSSYWEWNLWTPHALKWFEVVSWFTPMMVQYIHHTQDSLTYQMSMYHSGFDCGIIFFKHYKWVHVSSLQKINIQKWKYKQWIDHN